MVGSAATVAGLPVTGNPGDGWIVTDTGDLWFWSTAQSRWENIGKIVGPQGSTGPSGSTGPTGATGVAVSKFAIYGQRSNNISANSYYGFGNGTNSVGTGVTLPENAILTALTVDADTAYTADVSIEVLKNTVGTGQFVNVAIGGTNTVTDNLNYSFNKGDTLGFVTRAGAGGSGTTVTAWFATTGNVTYSATGPQGATGATGATGPTGVGAGSTTGSWTLSPGANTVSLTVPINGTYSIWVRGNIPNGIVTYTATVVVSNTNVPVLGSSYGWYYAAGNALVLTAIPTQIVGTQNNISSAVVSTTTANVFTFDITNNSGSSQVVNWGYITL